MDIDYIENTKPLVDAHGLKHIMETHSRVVVLTDDNVQRCCMTHFVETFGTNFDVVQIKAGEKNKNIETLTFLWQQLMNYDADRNTLLLNLGGGVVSDIGGFAASCYNRGIDFANVPTTLLAMIDASIGGKTGIDFDGVKNKIGLFADPCAIYIDTSFLDTLPQRQLMSGLAEMIKYGFIADKDMRNVTLYNFKRLIHRAITIKQTIVAADKYDNGQRRLLNFGHTIGHALEAAMLENGQDLLHGEAVAMGMYCALCLSEKLNGLPSSVVDTYKPIMSVLLEECTARLTDEVIKTIPQKLRCDKKNKLSSPVFVLLDRDEKPAFVDNVTETEISDTLIKLCRIVN